MTQPPTASSAREWIAHDPDPVTAAELEACSDQEIAERFAHPLTFGTAGLRGPLRGGPSGMNLAVVMRTSWAVAQVLKDRCLSGSRVVVGGDARHGSEAFALAAAEVIAAQGFHVTLMFAAVPTPVIAFGVRHLRADAGIQITASHNPPSDNGYKVYFERRPPDRPAHRPGNRGPDRQGTARRRNPQGGRRHIRGGSDPALCGPRGTRATHPRIGADRLHRHARRGR